MSGYIQASSESKKEIEHLKQYINNSACVFTRNGVSYKGSEAVLHIIRKEEYFKDKIFTAEDFVRLAATKSEVSGKNYTVSCIQGGVENLGEWFLKELIYYRAQKNSNK
jgi:hypothetical protein